MYSPMQNQPPAVAVTTVTDEEQPEESIVSSSSPGPPSQGDRPALLRSTSVLSDGTAASIKPDPPSVIEHRTVDFDWVQELLPRRGGDAAASLAAAESLVFQLDPREINHESMVFRDSFGEDHRVCGEEEGPRRPSLEEQELDSANAHHLQRVESLLRDDHVVSSSPLEAVLENEVLIPSPIVAEPAANNKSSAADLEMNGNSPVVSPSAPRSVSVELLATRPLPEVSSPLRSLGDQEPRVYDAPRQDPADDDEAGSAAVVAAKQRGQKHQKKNLNANASKPGLDLPSFSSHGYGNKNQPQPHTILTTPIVVRGSGRRRIQLRLQEEVRPPANGKSSRRSLLGHLRSRSSQIMWGSRDFKDLSDEANNNDAGSGNGRGVGGGAHNKSHPATTAVDRGTISVSWFEGTSAIELQEHVRTSVVRKLGLEKGVDVEDMRILDDSSDPPEGTQRPRALFSCSRSSSLLTGLHFRPEIVLSPHIPDGSRFLLRYTTRTVANDGATTPLSIYSGRAPDSPTATPPTNRLVGDLNASQLALLRKQLNALSLPQGKDVSVDEKEVTKSYRRRAEEEKKEEAHSTSVPPSVSPAIGKVGLVPPSDKADLDETKEATLDEEEDEDDNHSRGSRILSDLEDDYDDMMLHSEDPIEARLRQITELLIVDRQKKRSKYSSRRREKRQVIFVLANYFVLFLSLIAISAEIQARAPGWLTSLENQLQNVQNCAENKDALFECVSNGDFAGLIASVLLYLSRSVATRRFFLFGFETPNKLWTVVYESLVTSVCWGFSYLFIRRGLNPDTRPQFVQKYWKDCVYGSLAGFNAAFMKHVLKNLIPQEAVEDVLRERQLKFLSWLPSLRG